MKKGFGYYVLIVSIIIVDQITKAVIFGTINLYQNVKVIPGFLRLTHVHNRGAIFGFFSKDGSTLVQILLMVASLSALVFVVYYFFKTPVEERLMKASLSMVLAGALGNLVDRVVRGYVIDFVDMYVRSWHWPTYNVADSSITIGAILLVFVLLQRRPKCTPSSSD